MKKSEINPKNQRIQVFARCRPLNSFEKKQCSPSIVDIIPDKKIVVKDRNAHREFLFDKVFPPDTKQIAVYKTVVGPLIQEVLMGYNCTVFAYGQTGTGKTYTMEGERNNSQCSWEDDPGAGIIPRSLHQLFEDLNQEENVEFSVRVSFLELYNEELFDLLSSTDLSRLRLYEDSSKKGSVIIQGLEEIIVNSKDEVYSILERGTARRQTAATLLNASSSRSHTVFSVTVHIKENTIEGEELLKTGKLNLVDLAGSENVGRSGAVDKRAREAGNINQSLLTLGRVITALIEKQPHVPYRESKLTRLLQDSLGGHTKTSIIATVSPALCNYDETISTLDYATKAKSITIRPEVNQKTTKRALIREYTEEIEKLRKDLVALRSKEGFYIDRDNYQNLLTEIAEKEQKIKELSDELNELKEGNAKIEDMFCLTKEELTVTNEKLDKTVKQFEKTASELINTKNALYSTQQVLTETTLERDEKQFLINIQKNTEKKLFQQAQKLLSVADENLDDVEKLHAKIDRKTIVEKTNEERCQEFRVMYQRQFALLDELVSKFDQRQSTNLTNIKNYIDNLKVSLQSFKQQNDKYLNDFVTRIESNIKDIFTDVHCGSESLTNFTNTLIKDSSDQKNALSKMQNSFLCEKIPELVKNMNDRNSELESWVVNVFTQLSEMVNREKETVSKNAAYKKSLLSTVKESFESLQKSYNDIVEEYRKKISTDCTNEENFKKDFTKKFQELKSSLSEIEELVEKQENIRKNAAKLDSSIVTRLNEQALTMPEIQKPLMSLENLEDVNIEAQCSTLSSFLPIINAEQFCERQCKVNTSQNNFVSEINSFFAACHEVQEKQFSDRENSLKNSLTLISDNLLSTEGKLSVANSSLKDSSNVIEMSAAQIETVKNIIQFEDAVVTESQELITSTTKKVKDEILKRDLELEKFISDDLLKDIPTGTTPQRKTYSYPRLLAVTSPHERILERYRAQLAADTAIAVNLPLNSSFNELDESKQSLVSTEKSTDVTDEHNTSFSSDESTDAGSCASSMHDFDARTTICHHIKALESDLSVDTEKNKENKRLKKRSRLPKKLPSSNIFIKPAPLSSRKPLLQSNNYETEHF